MISGLMQIAELFRPFMPFILGIWFVLMFVGVWFWIGSKLGLIRLWIRNDHN